MDLLTTAFVCALFVIAAGVHRLTGMGFALVAVPPLVLLLGPDDAVTFAALGALLASVAVGVNARGDTDRAAAGVLVIAVLVGSLLGVVIAVLLPTLWLTIGIGVSILLAVAASILVRVRRRRGHPEVHRPRATTGPLAVAGVISGAMNATSAIGGPPLSVVASWTGMSHRVFVSTVQVPFVVMGVLTVGGRMLVVGVPQADGWSWVVLVAAVVVGVALGSRLAPHVPQSAAWLSTLIVAAGGAVALLATV